MNSSIFNFKTHRRFTVGLVTAMSLSMFAWLAFGLYLQPISPTGGLVRIGGYAERDYGWNLPQQGFTRPRYNSFSYDQYYDIVILGDSFSIMPMPYQWQNYLAVFTGQSITVLNRRKVKLEEVLKNPIFCQSPPKLFIYESVEGEMIDNLAIPKSITCPIASKTPRKETVKQKQDQIILPIDWRNYVTNDLMSVTRQIDLRSMKFAELSKHTKNYIIQNFLRDTLGMETTMVVRHKLTRPAPFSSLNTQTLLTHYEDLFKLNWKAKDIKEAGRELENIRRQVEANGYTRFIYMIPPDKTTAYADFLADEKLRHISFIPKLAEQSPSVIPRLDVPLQAAIQAGEMDIYLPDDTHWGWRGHQIAAETLLKFLHNP